MTTKSFGRWAAFGCIKGPSRAGKSEIPAQTTSRTVPTGTAPRMQLRPELQLVKQHAVKVVVVVIGYVLLVIGGLVLLDLLDVWVPVVE